MKIKAIALLAFTTFLVTTNVVAQTPFPSNIVVGLAKPGMNSAAKNYTIYTTSDISNGNYTQGVSFTPNYDINGIGLNASDHFLYGAAYVGNDNTASNLYGVSLRRVGSDGVMADLGLLPVSGQTGMEFPNFSAGTVGTDNTYYYTTMGLKQSGINKLGMAQMSGTQPDLNASDIRLFFCWVNNLSGRPLNAGSNMGNVTGYYELDFSNADITAGINAFLAQVNSNYPNIYNADGGIQDIAINPTDNKVYGYISYPQGGTTVGRPVVMNAAVNGIATITPVGTTINTVPGQEVAGVSFSQEGNFYGLFTTGHYAKINLSTGALENVILSNFATLNGNLRGDLGSSFTSTPLAIKLKDFTGKNNGPTNVLNWNIASEKNMTSFAIERSIDSKNWVTIGNVQASEATGSYNFVDINPENGTNFYRLKMNEDNESYTYSSVVSIINLSESRIVSYPNPVSDQLNITGLDQRSEIAVFDIMGKKLISTFTNQQNATISLSELPANTYILRIVQSGKVICNRKIVKK